MRALKIIAAILVLLIGVFVVRILIPEPEIPRPDLDLPLAPQMADPASAPMDMNFPAQNMMAGHGSNPIPHGDPAQQDSTPTPGPLDVTRRLKESEIRYQYLGPGHFGVNTSSPYPNGERVIWTNGVNGVFKLGEADYRVIDHIPSDVADKWNEDWGNKMLAKLDKNNGTSAMFTAVRSIAYTDAVKDDPNSEIIEVARFQLPPEMSGKSVGMNMTYDGWIVFPLERGVMIAVSPDLTEFRSVVMTHSDTQKEENRGVGDGWIRNSIAIDEEGGIYAASRKHMHKVVWTGDKLSVDPADGAWTAEYRDGTGDGTGATPSLMGFGDEDRFVVLTDGDIRMNVVLMWRDAIPDDWEQLDNAPSRRIAGQAPVDMGELAVTEIQSEQTVIVAGYGALVVNNTPRNVPFFAPKEGVGRGVLIGPLGNNPKFQPYGVQKFEWNPEARRLEKAWVNETISSPNGVPWVSTGSGQVYFIGARNHEWTLEAVNWLTGEPTFHYILGRQRYNNMFSGPTIDRRGRIFVGAYFGRMRLEPENIPLLSKN